MRLAGYGEIQKINKFTDVEEDAARDAIFIDCPTLGFSGANVGNHIPFPVVNLSTFLCTKLQFSESRYLSQKGFLVFRLAGGQNSINKLNGGTFCMSYLGIS